MISLLRWKPVFGLQPLNPAKRLSIHVSADSMLGTHAFKGVCRTDVEYAAATPRPRLGMGH
jgi:hypothetical protein